MGKSVIRFLIQTQLFFIKIYNRFIKRLLRYLKRHIKHFLRSFKGVGEFFKREVSNITNFFTQAHSVLKEGYNRFPEAGVLTRLKYLLKAFVCGVKNNTKYFKTLFNYALPIAGIVLVVCIAGYIKNLNFAVEVTYKGENLGYVDSEYVYQSAEDKLQARMVYNKDDETLETTPSFAIKLLGSESLKTDKELTDAMLQASEDDIVKATGIIIDDKFYGAVKDASEISAYLSDTLEGEKEKVANENASVKFSKNIYTEEGIFLTSNIVEEKSILDLLSSSTQQDVYYTIAAGDTPISIAEKNGITLDELVALNSNIITRCVVGERVQLNKAKPFLSISVTKTETYTVSVPYTTKTIQSSAYYKGVNKVTQNGQNGQSKVVALVEYIDGAEVSRDIISDTVISYPIQKVVTQGTKKPPSGPSYSGPTSSYGLIWPVQGGYISTYYGQHYFNGVHTGIDIAFRGNGYGKPIYAAHSGTIVKSGYSGGYGNVIVVQSGGLQTWYAHCSSLNYRVGQKVSQGQIIARVGSTGNSTGNHLHFMVYVNGSRKNPLNYLPR